jgi:hypothetical protein
VCVCVRARAHAFALTLPSPSLLPHKHCRRPQRLLLETLLRCAEACLSREDAALFLTLLPRLVDVVSGAYSFTYRPQPSSSPSPSPSSSPSIRVARCGADPVTFDYGCRIVARFVSIQSANAEGHWRHWSREYAGGQAIAQRARPAESSHMVDEGIDGGDGVKAMTQDDDEEGVRRAAGDPLAEGRGEGNSAPAPAPTPIPSNWPFLAIAHICRMGMPRAWARALAGHCAVAAPGVAGLPTSSAPSPPLLAATITGTGYGLARSTAKSVIRALTRVLVVLKAAEELAEAGRGEEAGGDAGRGGGGAAASSSSSSSSSSLAATFTDLARVLVEEDGLLLILQRLIGLYSGEDGCASAGGGAEAGGDPTTAAAAASSLSTQIVGALRDGELLEDCLLLAAALVPR